MATIVSIRSLPDLLSDEEFWAEQKTAILEELEPVFFQIFAAGALVGASLTPSRPRKPAAIKAKIDDFLDIDPGLLDDAARQLFRTYTDAWWAGLETSSREAIRAAITRAADEGLSIADTIREIEPIFGTARAKRIAVTETTRLFGKGAIATYQEAGYDGWRWHTVGDSHVCPICEGRSGDEFPLDHGFEPAHVSCRCFATPVQMARSRRRRRA